MSDIHPCSGCGEPLDADGRDKNDTLHIDKAPFEPEDRPYLAGDGMGETYTCDCGKSLRRPGMCGSCAAGRERVMEKP